MRDVVCSPRPARLMIRTILFLVILFPLCDSPKAFDGVRTGFVAGIGVGVAPVAHWSSSFTNIDSDEVGLAGNGFIGYAWDNSNALVYAGNGCMYSSSFFNDTYFLQGIDAIWWYHFWGRGSRRFFTTVGPGRIFIGSEYCNLNASGLGFGGGFGYELSRDFQLGLYYFGGHTSNDDRVSANHSVVSVVLTFNKY